MDSQDDKVFEAEFHRLLTKTTDVFTPAQMLRMQEIIWRREGFNNIAETDESKMAWITGYCAPRVNKYRDMDCFFK